MLMAMYYSFTSLSTVGFGDLYPVSNSERLLVCCILIFGVSVFSYIMGIFTEILDKFSQLNSDLDQGDELAKFFGLLKRFNNNVDIKNKFKEKIEDFFDMKWNLDRTMALTTDEDLAMF